MIDSELPDGWHEVLPECDFAKAGAFFKEMLDADASDAAERGGSYYYEPAFLTALRAFIDAPALATATQLLETAPMLSVWRVFESCRPGGIFRFLED